MADQPRRIEYVPIAEVVTAERNPRPHDSIEDVRASIRDHGFVDAAVHDGRTGRIIAGHGRLEALLGMEAAGDAPPEGVMPGEQGWLMPLQYGWSSRDDDEAERLLVFLNRSVEQSGWDPRGLVELLSDLATAPVGLAGTGFQQRDLDAMLARISPEPPEAFPEIDPTAMQLAHTCPRCGFEWTGSGG